MTGRMEPIHKKFTDILMTKRLQTLQSIDEAIERVIFLHLLRVIDSTQCSKGLFDNRKKSKLHHSPERRKYS